MKAIEPLNTSPATAPVAPRPVSALNEDELAALFKSWGEPAFRATQLREFLFRKGVRSYEGITNLSKPLRERLKREAPLYEMEEAGSSGGDDATKWLWRSATGAHCCLARSLWR